MSDSVDFATKKANNFKCLLFADNPEHMKLLQRIKRQQFFDGFCGAWHTETDEQQQEIIKGAGKKHVHLILCKKGSPVHWRSVCKQLQADERFLRPVGVHDSLMQSKKESLKKGLQYLVHANCPEKGLLPASALFGSDWLVQQALQAISEALAKDVSMSGAVQGVCQWIQQQHGVISMQKLIDFLCSSSYFKAQQSRLIYQVMQEHNDKCRRDAAKQEARFRQQEQWEARTGLDNFRSVRSSIEVSSYCPFDISEFEEIL